MKSARLMFVDKDFDGCASKAYYAAFHAVTAWFLLKARFFKKHSALEAAVHRDLVHAGLWGPELGRDYIYLMDRRGAGDYGRGGHVSDEDADVALEAAARIIEAVHKLAPDEFPWPSGA
ncbi:MAG: HEPN domain-containing protein [Thermodesulfobacteriota bacterium]